MKNLKIQEHIVNANFSKLKYLSLVGLGFSFFYLFSDFLVQGVWSNESLNIYKALDIFFAIISVLAVCFFWLFKTKNSTLRNAGILLYSFLCIIWSAIITSIDFTQFGFSTLVTVILVAAFFLYLNLLVSILIFVSSGIVLIATLFILGKIDDSTISLIFILIPILGISVLISAKNHRNKRNDLINKEKMSEMYRKLQYSNQNLESEIEKRTKDIRTALEKAEESDNLKSAFLANMSHEIRTPMNGILGFAELLKEPELTGEEQQKYIRIIEKSGIRMLNIINDIINISKIESGLMKVDIKNSNINDQIEDIYAFFKPEVEGKGMLLIFKNELPKDDANIKTDQEKFIAILTNLIKNAIKYSDQGTIEFGYKLIKNDTTPELEFFVKDTGMGIPEDRQKAIFDRFIQIDNSDLTAFSGAGLGLSISKAYVEMLGGKIRVESEVRKGSAFYFTLPYYRYF